jgi:hypothetical protein
MDYFVIYFLLRSILIVTSVLLFLLNLLYSTKLVDKPTDEY